MPKYNATLYYTNDLEYDSIPFFTEKEILSIANEYAIEDGRNEFDSFDDDAWEYLESETNFGAIHCTTQRFNEDEVFYDKYDKEYSVELYYSSELDTDSIPFFTQSELIVEANALRAQNKLEPTDDFDEACTYLESTHFGVICSATQYFDEDEMEIIED